MMTWQRALLSTYRYLPLIYCIILSHVLPLNDPLQQRYVVTFGLPDIAWCGGMNVSIQRHYNRRYKTIWILFRLFRTDASRKSTLTPASMIVRTRSASPLRAARWITPIAEATGRHKSWVTSAQQRRRRLKFMKKLWRWVCESWQWSEIQRQIVLFAFVNTTPSLLQLQ